MAPTYPGFAFEREALSRLPALLAEWTGMRATLQQEAAVGSYEVDVVAALDDLTFIVEVKGRSDVAAVEAAISRVQRASAEVAWQGPGHVPLVVVPHMTPTGRKRCEAAGVSWADLSGNAHVRARGERTTLYVHVEGRPNAFPALGRPRNAFAPKAARLARFLLAAPTRPRTQTEIAEGARLDAGYTSRLVQRLLEAGLLVRLDDGAVLIEDPDLFLDAWADANAYRHAVVEGHLPGRSGEERALRLQDALLTANVAHAITGLAAAWAYTHVAAFRSVSCYVVPEVPHNALEAAGFRAQTEAPNVRLLVPDDEGVFQGARTASGLHVVTPAQAYVDLRHEPERAEELAEALRPLVLHPPADS